MAASLAPQWIFQALTDAGAVASGAKLHSFLAGGGSVRVPLLAEDGITPLSNPFEVNAAGRGNFRLNDAVSYRLRLETAAGVLIDERDNVQSASGAFNPSGSADRIGYADQSVGAVLGMDVHLEDYDKDAADGVTNAYTAWTSAVADLTAAGGGRIMLGAGTYKMTLGASTYLTIPAGVAVVGRGSKSIISLPDSGSGKGALKPSAGNLLESFAIEGPGDARSGAAGSSGIYATGATDLTILNVEISGVSGAGMNLKNAQRVEVSGCYVHDTGADGIHMPSGVKNIRVYGNYCENTGDDGISVVGYDDGSDIPDAVAIFGNIVRDGHARGITVVGGRKVTIANNLIENCSVSGILVTSEGSYNTFPCTDIRVVGNTVYRVGRTYYSVHGSSGFAYAVFLAGRSSRRSSGIVCEGNFIRDCAGISGGAANANTNAIYAQYVDDLTIRGNQVSAGPFQETGDAAQLNRWAYILHCSDITVEGNEFDTCKQIGVYIDSNCTGYASIKANKLTDAATSGSNAVIQIDAPDLILSVSGNIERNPTSTPTYFLRMPSGITDPTQADIGGNVTTLGMSGVPAGAMFSSVYEVATFADLGTIPPSGRLYIQQDRGLALRGQGAATSGISNATGRNYTDMDTGPDGALWVTVYGGYIYRGIPDVATGSVSWVADASAVALGNLNWRWIKRVGKRLYAGIDGGTIYQATVSAAGAATWTTTGATDRAYRCACRISDTEFLTSVDAGDIYKGTIAGATVTYSALSAGAATRQGIAYIGGWLWYTVSGTDIYRVEYAGGVLGTPVAQGVGSSVAWRGIGEGPDRNIYATTSTGMWRGVASPFGVTWTDLALATSADRRGMAVGTDGRLHIAGYGGVSRFYKTAYVALGGA